MGEKRYEAPTRGTMLSVCALEPANWRANEDELVLASYSRRRSDNGNDRQGGFMDMCSCMEGGAE